MTPLPKAAGKTWWEHQRTGLSKLVAVVAFIVLALTQSHWELQEEPGCHWSNGADLVFIFYLRPQGRRAGH